MKGATFAIATASLALCALGCGSGDDCTCPAGSSVDGGDAHSGDAASADVASDSTSGDATPGDATTGDAMNEAAGSTDATGESAPMEAGDARSPNEGGDSATDSAQASDTSTLPDAPPTTVALLRIANWSPDAPAIDACIAPHGTTVFQGPLVRALASSSQVDAGAAGVSFPFVSAYAQVSPGQYDMRVVVAGAADCSVGVGPDRTSLPALALGGAATFALLGEVAPVGGDPHLSVVGFLDDISSKSGVALRFINASPALTPLDFGTGSDVFVTLFRGVAFGKAGAMLQAAGDAAAPVVDANGYETVSKLMNATLSARASSATADAMAGGATTTGLSAASGSVLTIAIVGGTSAGAQAQFVECVDNAGSAGVLSNCSVLP